MQKNFPDLYASLFESCETLKKAELLANFSSMAFSVTQLKILKNRIKWNFTGFEDVVEAIEKLIAKHHAKNN